MGWVRKERVEKGRGSVRCKLTHFTKGMRVVWSIREAGGDGGEQARRPRSIGREIWRKGNGSYDGQVG